jgi:hypothetical protein
VKIRKIIKKVGRLHAKVFAKTVKIVAPVASAVASIYGGPAAGAAVTGSLAITARYASAASNRGKGWSHAKINEKARSLRKQVLKYGMLGTGVGAATAAIAGGSVLSGLTGLGSSTLSKLGIASPPLNRDVRDFGPLPALGADPGGEAPAGMGSFASSSPAGARIYNDQETSLTKIPGVDGKSTNYSSILTSVLGIGAKALERSGASSDRSAPAQAGLLGGLTGDGGALDVTNPDGSTDWMKIALIGGGVLLLVTMAKKAA